ncbi:glycosyltransferase [Patescibacteria group bacterium]|nr:glycosyltransferase [Patescibacteria group bacterium]
MNEKIFGVIVTYNRKHLLEKCLDSLLSQKVKLDGIIVVNNSTDDTAKFLEERGFLNKSGVFLFNSEKNLGSAGGFKKGIELALNAGADWILTTDDDVVADEYLVRNFLRYKDFSHCMCANKKDTEGNWSSWEGILLPQWGFITTIGNDFFKNGREFSFTNFASFEGMFINRSLIDKIGLPDERFFICLDDTAYGFLASLFTNIIYVRDARMERQLTLNPNTKIGVYYNIRNQFLINEYLIGKGYLTKTRGFFVAMARASKKIILSFFLFDVGIFRASIKGLFDGLRGKFGKLEGNL